MNTNKIKIISPQPMQTFCFFVHWFPSQIQCFFFCINLYLLWLTPFSAFLFIHIKGLNDIIGFAFQLLRALKNKTQIPTAVLGNHSALWEENTDIETGGPALSTTFRIKSTGTAAVFLGENKQTPRISMLKTVAYGYPESRQWPFFSLASPESWPNDIEGLSLWG